VQQLEVQGLQSVIRHGHHPSYWRRENHIFISIENISILTTEGNLKRNWKLGTGYFRSDQKTRNQ
jgi:hypothetical protein